MEEESSMKRIYFMTALTVILLGVLIMIDQLKNDEPFILFRFALDVLEKTILVAAVVAIAYVAIETKGLKRERIDLHKDLARVRSESDTWRNAARSHVEGLGRAIAEQFKLWKLSESETDIALLMLKGLTFKEIANLRGSEETTVRQQATAVYRKSGLANRTELGAYFLEDLLAPAPRPAPDPVRRFEVVHSQK
jgi:DNA-binding CsgD family transcriptional regulator